MIGTLPGPLGSWARLLGLNRPELAGTTLWHTQNTLAHSFPELCWLTPESAVFEHFKLCTFLAHLAVLAVMVISGPTLATKMSQGLLGLCCLIESRDRIEISNITAVLFE